MQTRATQEQPSIAHAETSLMPQDERSPFTTPEVLIARGLAPAGASPEVLEGAAIIGLGNETLRRIVEVENVIENYYPPLLSATIEREGEVREALQTRTAIIGTPADITIYATFLQKLTRPDIDNPGAMQEEIPALSCMGILGGMYALQVSLDERSKYLREEAPQTALEIAATKAALNELYKRKKQLFVDLAAARSNAEDLALQTPSDNTPENNKKTAELGAEQMTLFEGAATTDVMQDDTTDTLSLRRQCTDSAIRLQSALRQTILDIQTSEVRLASLEMHVQSIGIELNTLSQVKSSFDQNSRLKKIAAILKTMSDAHETTEFTSAPTHHSAETDTQQQSQPPHITLPELDLRAIQAELGSIHHELARDFLGGQYRWALDAEALAEYVRNITVEKIGGIKKELQSHNTPSVQDHLLVALLDIKSFSEHIASGNSPVASFLRASFAYTSALKREKAVDQAWLHDCQQLLTDQIKRGTEGFTATHITDVSLAKKQPILVACHGALTELREKKAAQATDQERNFAYVAELMAQIAAHEAALTRLDKEAATANAVSQRSIEASQDNLTPEQINDLLQLLETMGGDMANSRVHQADVAYTSAQKMLATDKEERDQAVNLGLDILGELERLEVAIQQEAAVAIKNEQEIQNLQTSRAAKLVRLSDLRPYIETIATELAEIEMKYTDAQSQDSDSSLALNTESAVQPLPQHPDYSAVATEILKHAPNTSVRKTGGHMSSWVTRLTGRAAIGQGAEANAAS